MKLPTFKISSESLVERIAKSFEDELADQIKRALMKEASAIVTDVARNMARALQTRVTEIREPFGERIEIVLEIDGVKELIKDTPPTP